MKVDYKAFAKQLLRSKKRMEVAKQNLTDELLMLNEAKTAVSTVPGQSIPLTGGGSRFEERLVKLISVCDDLELRRRNIEMNLQCIERGMASLNETERSLQETYYIKGERYAADTAMEVFHKERSTVYREADRALARFTETLYGSVPPKSIA